mmetsp:Transcript_33205/g.40735  ORF Transcript_33205/g.40735 Transcript_33205/m.40735 type:complete len:83 (+) Transcript_33205:282-530(+)
MLIFAAANAEELVDPVEFVVDPGSDTCNVKSVTVAIFKGSWEVVRELLVITAAKLVSGSSKDGNDDDNKEVLYGFVEFAVVV